MPEYKYNADIIPAIMLVHDITPAEFGRRVGKSRQTVYNWLGGEVPGTKTLIKICAEFPEVKLSSFYLVENEAKWKSRWREAVGSGLTL